MKAIQYSDERVWQGGHAWNYEGHVRNNEHSLRVSIRRNAHDEQSWARVHRWDGTKWQLVLSRPICECHCKTISYIQQGVKIAAFKKDTEELLQATMGIIG